MASGGGVHKESGACPNGCGLESSPVGIPGASGRRPHRAPLARTHYRVTFRTAATPPHPRANSALWIETNYVGDFIFFILFFFMSHIKSCPAGTKSVSPSCHLHKKAHKSSRHGWWLDFFFSFLKTWQVQHGQTLKAPRWLITCEQAA